VNLQDALKSKYVQLEGKHGNDLAPAKMVTWLRMAERIEMKQFVREYDARFGDGWLDQKLGEIAKAIIYELGEREVKMSKVDSDSDDRDNCNEAIKQMVFRMAFLLSNVE